jgi:hypothetical protein
MNYIKCVDCKRPCLTWADQRRQYGRVLRAGLTPKEAKALMPRCQKCTTKALREIKLGLDHEPHPIVLT